MIYRATYVLPMDGRLIENGEVLVRDGEIEALGTDLSARHPGGAVCELGKCALLPGFVNAHCHLDATLVRNAADALNLWDWIDRVCFNRTRCPDYHTVLASATLGAAELARSGVTCVGDCTFSGAAADALAAVGLRGIAYKEVFGQSIGEDCSARFAALVDELRQSASRLPPTIQLGISPHTIYTSNRGLLQLCAESDLPIGIHLAETAAETDYSLTGTGPIADWRKRLGYEPMTTGLTPTRYLAEVGLLRPNICLAHCVHLSSDEIDLVADSGAGIAHCPRSNAYLGAGIAAIPALIKAGAGVGLGTDGAGSCMRLDFFEEMRFALAVHRAAAQDAAVITAKQVLEMATIGGAKALGLDDRIGTLEPGKRADMIAIDLSDVLPGEDLRLAMLSRSPADVVMTMVDGEAIVSEGRAVRVDEIACHERLAESEWTGDG